MVPTLAFALRQMSTEVGTIVEARLRHRPVSVERARQSIAAVLEVLGTSGPWYDAVMRTTALAHMLLSACEEGTDDFEVHLRHAELQRALDLLYLERHPK